MFCIALEYEKLQYTEPNINSKKKIIALIFHFLEHFYLLRVCTINIGLKTTY